MYFSKRASYFFHVARKVVSWHDRHLEGAHAIFDSNSSIFKLLCLSHFCMLVCIS